MAIYYDSRTTYAGDDASISFPSPGSGGDGDLFVMFQTSDIGGFDKPAGWKTALAVTGSVGLDVWYGIQGVDFANAGGIFEGNSLGRATQLFRMRIEGNVDETCEVIANSKTFADGDPTSGYFSCDNLEQIYADRERINVAFGGQEASLLEWLSFTGSYGLTDGFHHNVVELGGSGGSVAMGLTWAEDNGAIQPRVGGNRFYTQQPAQAGWRVALSNVIIYGAAKKQTDILTPPPTF